MVHLNDPVYLSTPKYYQINKGETLTEDLASLFCLLERQNSAGVSEYAYRDFANDYFHISISSSYMIMEFTPPENFTGTQAVVYELCFGLPDDCEQNPDNCVRSDCNYYLNIPIIVEVI